MARRKRRAPVQARTRTRTVVKKVRGRRKSPGMTPTKIMMGGFAYGLARGKVAQLISPLTSKIPMGQYADELGMGILNYYIAKGKVPFIPKHIGQAGLAIESFVIGQDVGAGNFNLNNKSSTKVQGLSF